MRLLAGVDAERVHPFLWYKLAKADEHHERIAGVELVVTSLRRPWVPGARPSKHSPPGEELCTAADLRRWRLDTLSATVDFCRWLQVRLDLGVLLEPDWMTSKAIEARGGLGEIDPHIHVQLREAPAGPSWGFGVL